MGKGSLWRVEQQYKQNLIIALTRSSYHPNTSAMEKATASLKSTPISPESPSLKVLNCDYLIHVLLLYGILRKEDY